jgi:hypothetical protein
LKKVLDKGIPWWYKAYTGAVMKTVIIDGIKYYPKKAKSPLRSIRYFCFECMGWDRQKRDSGRPFEDVKNCSDDLCPLYEFRFGRNSYLNLKGKLKGNLEALKKYHRSKR